MNSPHIPQVRDVVDGKYILDRVLGKGGFGIVFEAKHANLPGQRVAIKFLLERQLNNPEERERFNRESHVGTLLQSGRNVRVLDAGEFASYPNAPGIPYIVMEYLDGKDLNAHVESYGPLPIQSAVDYILQACIALAEAHSHGIFHRDLKPANLFLTSHLGAPFIKVLDFGLAKTNTGPSGVPATTTGLIMLSVGYAPPEQQKGLKLADALSDIFSLAATLYFLLTGSLPFAGQDIHDIMVAVARDAPIPLGRFRPDVPRGLIEVIERALEKQPKARPQSVVELAQMLVPFGSAEAMRLFADVERAAALGKPVVEKAQGGGTIKMDQPALAPPSTEPPTMQWSPARAAQLASTAAAIPTPPPAPPTVPVIPQAHRQEPVPRQTNRSSVVIGSLLVALAILATSIALWTSRHEPPQLVLETPSASAMKGSDPLPKVVESASLAPLAPTSSASVVPVVASMTPSAATPASFKKTSAPKATTSSKFSKGP